jgi:hypothetical protein
MENIDICSKKTSLEELHDINVYEEISFKNLKQDTKYIRVISFPYYKDQPSDIYCIQMIENRPNHLVFTNLKRGYIMTIPKEAPEIKNSKFFQISSKHENWVKRKNYISLEQGTPKADGHISKYLFNDMVMREISQYLGKDKESGGSKKHKTKK